MLLNVNIYISMNTTQSKIKWKKKKNVRIKTRLLKQILGYFIYK